MPYHQFAIGTTAANMANVESTYSVNPPYIPTPAPRVGSVPTTLGSGKTRNDGFITFPWVFDLDSVNAVTRMDAQLTGGYLATSAQVYVSTIDDTGYYSTYLCYWNRPDPVSYQTVANGAYKRGYLVQFTGGVLQYATKTVNTNLTASERLVFGDTSGGSRTLTLPLANAIAANTVISIARTSSSNTLSVSGNTGQTIDGAGSVDITGIYNRRDFISDGSSSWTSRTVS